MRVPYASASYIGYRFWHQPHELIQAFLTYPRVASKNLYYVDRERRQAQGQAKAKAEGRYKGRREDVERNAAIGWMLASMQSWDEIQNVTGCSRATVAKIA